MDTMSALSNRSSSTSSSRPSSGTTNTNNFKIESLDFAAAADELGGGELVFCRGPLVKQGTGNRFSWKARYFLLIQNCMFYYESEGLEKLVGMIFIEGATIQEIDTPSGQQGSALVITTLGNRPYTLIAPDAEERQKWIDAVRQAQFSFYFDRVPQLEAENSKQAGTIKNYEAAREKLMQWKISTKQELSEVRGLHPAPLVSSHAALGSVCAQSRDQIRKLTQQLKESEAQRKSEQEARESDAGGNSPSGDTKALEEQISTLKLEMNRVVGELEDTKAELEAEKLRAKPAALVVSNRPQAYEEQNPSGQARNSIQELFSCFG